MTDRVESMQIGVDEVDRLRRERNTARKERDAARKERDEVRAEAARLGGQLRWYVELAGKQLNSGEDLFQTNARLERECTAVRALLGRALSYLRVAHAFWPPEDKLEDPKYEYTGLDLLCGEIEKELGGKTRPPYDGAPCTCKDDCSTPCKGKCGCEACETSYQDFLSEE